MASRRRSATSTGAWAVVGLAAGLATGAAIAAAGQPTLVAIGSGVEVAGKLWINAILMTILPLVVAKLVVSIAGQDVSPALGRAGWRAVALFVVLLTTTAALTAALMPAVFARLPINALTPASLHAAAPALSTPQAPPSVLQSVLGLVPSNAIRAASDGAIVPLLVFTVAFALAAGRIPRHLRDPLLTLFRAVDAAITTLLHWIVAMAPFGVFALGLGLAVSVGGGAVVALVGYIAVSSTALVVFTALLYPVVWLLAHVPLGRFARACAPAQTVAFGTHSSMASLPAMLDGAESRLGLSGTSTGFVLPLSLAVFKYSGPIWFITATYFVGRLYGVTIAPSRAVAIVLVAVVTSLAIGGVPSGAAVVLAPVLAAAGLPVEAMGVLLAVDPIPNAFRTVANVTGMMAVTAMVGAKVEPDRLAES
ncbi:MAG: cation:dicarboxylase symporter family transporter [Thermoanaerobaculaceae bacterium]|nr:cation:dicarboxylase symporter family transporter [Thermoanaerobaculaceae bacterium]TAM54947.1 MAG: cation:dicarboxylase symporter family transporter [Acidobacteriota bacterium]